MSEKFQVGTVVCLKSGGPAMTVESLPQEIMTTYIASPMVKVQWFAGDLMQRDTVPLACLELAVMILDGDDEPEDRVLSS